jgi:hypothetical protein
MGRLFWGIDDLKTDGITPDILKKIYKSSGKNLGEKMFNFMNTAPANESKGVVVLNYQISNFRRDVGKSIILRPVYFNRFYWIK